MNGINKLTVLYHGRIVGTLAEIKDGSIIFEYHPTWLTDGFPISPFSLPLRKEVFIAKIDPFDGLYGVFSDSLPDGWGRLLVDRLLLKNHLDPYAVGNLTRLAIVGDSGMGALTYEPVFELSHSTMVSDFDLLAGQTFRPPKK